jgi:hypothetical protein
MSTTDTRLLGAAALVAALCVLGGFTAGRATAPRQKEIATVETEASASAYARGASVVTIRIASAREVDDSKESVRIVTRWVPTPAGPAVEQTTERTTERHREATTGTREEALGEQHETQAQAKVVERVRIVRTPAPEPRFALGAAPGIGLDGRTRWAGVAQVRVLGPVSVVAIVTSDLGREAAAFLGLGMRW